MTRVLRDVAAVIETSARDGRIARARSVARDLNPHRQPAQAIHPRLWPPESFGMLHAWWHGWDQTDRELRG